VNSQRLFLFRGLLWGWLFFFGQQGAAFSLEGLPVNWEKHDISHLKKEVIDGDTFRVDLNEDGRFSTKKESIRLLYVDTPELSFSHKGKNLKFGIPAKRFLHNALQYRSIVLWVDPKNSSGNYGRTLGVLQIKTHNVNLKLISEGHSYFDTRFSRPLEYQVYAKAEIQAFDNYRGIWSTRASRKAYLNRLRTEGTTVYSHKNPYFIARKRAAEFLNPRAYNGRFVRVYGVVKSIKKLRNGAKIWYLDHRRLKGGLAVISFRKQRVALNLEGNVKRGDKIHIEGFVNHYKNRIWQIQLHRGFLLP